MPQNDPAPEASAVRTDLPSFALSYAVDSETDPSRVTVYSPEKTETGTHWITIDADHAVDLADVL